MAAAPTASTIAAQYMGQQRRDLSPRRWRHILPPKGSDATQFYQFFQLRCDPTAPYRTELVREWLGSRAMYLSHQWLDLAVGDARDPRRAVRFTDPNPLSSIPKPVTNEILPVVDNETAKLYKRRSEGYVRPVALQERAGSSSGGSAAATDILRWQLDTIRWPYKRRRSIFRTVLYGTGYFWSHLDQSYSGAVKIGIAGALRCVSGCGFVGASAEIPAGGLESRGLPMDLSRMTRQVGPFNPQTAENDVALHATSCLKCGAPVESFTTDGDQVEGSDFFGRPLGQETPVNFPDLEIPHPIEMFPENDGINVEPESWREMVRCVPRSMDWVEEHYPGRVNEVIPDDPLKIADQFPITGEYSYGSMGATSTHLRNLWKDHVLFYYGVKKPNYREKMGRFVTMAGRVLMEDADLCRRGRYDSKVLVPKVSISVARFYIRDGELQGQGVVESIKSPQNRINMAYSQAVDHRQRNMVSGILGTTGMRFVSGWLDGFPGRFVRWEPDPSNPTMEPKFIDGKGIDQGIYQEIDRTTERMSVIPGTQDADIGKAPRNVQAATAIQLLQEAAAGRREGREQELIDAFREVYSHQLLLLSEYAVEPRQYLAPTANGKWEFRDFKAKDLAGHTDVIVEEQAGYDARAFEREAIAAAIQLQIVTLSTPYARREAAKMYGISMKIMDEENTQINDAESKWYAFRDLGVVPEIDPTLDAHDLHFDIYGRFLKSIEGQDLAEKNGWLELLPQIAGWEDKYKSLDTMQQMVSAMESQASGGDPLTAGPAQAMMASPEIAKIQAMLQSAPKDAARRVLWVWEQMTMGQEPQVDALGQPMADPVTGQPAVRQVPILNKENPYTRFRAVHAGHKMLGEKVKAQAMVGPVLAPPGGRSTTVGTEPVLGSAPTGGPAPNPGGMTADQAETQQK